MFEMILTIFVGLLTCSAIDLRINFAESTDCYGTYASGPLENTTCPVLCNTYMGLYNETEKNETYTLFRRNCRFGSYRSPTTIVANGMWSHFNLDVSGTMGNLQWGPEKVRGPAECQYQCEMIKCAAWLYRRDSQLCAVYLDEEVSVLLAEPGSVDTQICKAFPTQGLYENDVCLDHNTTCLNLDKNSINGFPYGRATKSQCSNPNPMYPPFFNTYDDWAKINVPITWNGKLNVTDAQVPSDCSHLISIDQNLSFNTNWCRQMCLEFMTYGMDLMRWYHTPFNAYCREASFAVVTASSRVVSSLPYLTGFVPKSEGSAPDIPAIRPATCKEFCEEDPYCDFWVWRAVPDGSSMCSRHGRSAFANDFNAECSDGEDVCGDGVKRCIYYPHNAVSGWRTGLSPIGDLCPTGHNEFLFPRDVDGITSRNTTPSVITRAPSASTDSTK